MLCQSLLFYFLLDRIGSNSAEPIFTKSSKKMADELQ